MVRPPDISPPPEVKVHAQPSLRPKTDPYHFDALSDIDSMNGSPAHGGPSRMKETRREGSPPEEIMRLPLTWWMNSNAKNRKRRHAVSLKAYLLMSISKTLWQRLENSLAPQCSSPLREHKSQISLLIRPRPQMPIMDTAQ